jgi:hypothetical protein
MSELKSRLLKEEAFKSRQKKERKKEVAAAAYSFCSM